MYSIIDNSIAKRLREKGKVCAAWAQLGSNVSSEILAEAGFDALIIDAEHAPTTTPLFIGMMQSLKGTPCIPIVRVAWNDMVLVKQALDCGAAGVHIPYVSTREEAEYAVKSCRYPMEGFRGIASSHRAVCYGMNKSSYYKGANQDIICMIAIETPEGVNNIEEIVKVDGLDGIFIGPTDLSTSMGYMATPQEPKVQEAIRKIENIVIPSNKFLGTVASSMAEAIELYERGYNLLYVLSDSTGLAALAQSTVREFQNYISKPH